MLKNKLIILLLALTAMNLAAQNNRIIIDSGHNSAVAALGIHEETGRMISADETGLIKVWDLNANKLEYQIDTGLRGSLEIKIHPLKNEIAVLTTRPGFTGLSVWDWKTGRNLFTKTLPNRPVQFDYSGSGKYIFIVQVGNPSIILYDSISGREFSYLRRMSGLFSYAYIGSTEATIMTYSNSGYFRYYDIRTASLKNESSTMEDLKDITVLQTEGKRYIIARKDNSLFLIDRLSGEVRDALTQPDMVNFSIDQKSGVVTTATSSDTGRLKMSYSSTEGARFSPLSASDYLNRMTGNPSVSDPGFFRLTDSLRSLLAVNNRVFLSDNGGTIWEMNRTSLKPEVFKKSILSDIRDISITGKNLYLLTKDEIAVLNSNFFERSEQNLSRLSDFNIRIEKNPLPGESYMESYDLDRLLIWSSENNGYGYVLYNPEAGQVLNSNNNYKSALRQIHIRNNQILALESSGEASLNNLHTGIREFNFSALGMVSLNFIDNDTLMAGKSLMRTGTNPLITVQAGTGEITPFNDNRFLVHNIISPEKGSSIYTIGLKQNGDGSIETQIRSHQKTDPSLETVLYTIDGEWINSILTVDTSSFTPTLYGSINGRDIFRLRGSQRKEWSYDKNIKNIFYHDSLLYILNSDGSLTLFDTLKGKKLVDYFLLEDNNWIALPEQSSDEPVINNRDVKSVINSYSKTTGRPVASTFKVMSVQNN